MAFRVDANSVLVLCALSIAIVYSLHLMQQRIMSLTVLVPSLSCALQSAPCLPEIFRFFVWTIASDDREQESRRRTEERIGDRCIADLMFSCWQWQCECVHCPLLVTETPSCLSLVAFLYYTDALMLHSMFFLAH